MGFSEQSKSHRWNFESLRWRILLIVIVAALGFAVYLAVNLMESRRQASLLEQIQHQRYPLQAELQQAMFSLKQVQAQLEDAVVTGEIENLAEASEFAKQFRKSLHTAHTLDVKTQQTVESIEQAFERYYRGTFRLASEMAVSINPTQQTIDRGRENNEAFMQVVTLLESFQSRELKAFTDSVDHVTARANTIVWTGFFTGLVTVILLCAVVGFLIRRVLGRIGYMVDALRTIAEESGGMSVRIPINSRDEMSELAYWFNSFIDKLERLTLKNTKEMERLAYTDTLTELPNRRSFNLFLQREMENCQRNHDLNLSILFLDLDNFKGVNDQLGHDAGDILLCEVASRLKETLRSSDLVALDERGGERLVARMGGDEFMLLVGGLHDPADVVVVAERVRRAVLAPIVIDEQSLQVGVSIGIATYSGDGGNAEELVINADLAMYEAKKRGKNSYCFFDEEIGRAAQLNLQMDKLLRNALQHDELELYLQPKFNLFSGEVSGAEVLLRWNSPQLGFVSPDEFITAAENSNLIYELDKWVLEKTCLQINSWQRRGVCQIPIAMNISAKQAGNHDLIHKVERALELSPIAANSLELEITETSALAHLETVADNIRGLKKLSVKVALDDFGAGHSSLSLLKHCDIDTLKIDRGFITEMETKDNARAIVETVISLAKKLRVEVIAEGVETDQQADMLRDIGCGSVQGYLFARPMPLVEFEAFMRGEKLDKASG